MNDALDEIADELRRHQDAQLKQRSVPSLIVDVPEQNGFSRTFAVFGLVAAAAVVVAIVMRPSGAEPSSSSSSSSSSHDGPVALAFEQTARGFAFNDGSKVDVTGSAHVKFVDDRGATVDVDSGSVAASFLPREQAAWAVEAGPYALRTQSARLDVAYDGSRLVVHVLDGQAVLSGPNVAPQTLAAGASVDLVAPSPVPSPLPIAPATPTPTKPAPTTPQVATTTATPPTTGAEPVASAAPVASDGGVADEVPAHGATWQELARGDKHAEAVTEVRRMGLASVVDASNADDLVLLGTSARLIVDIDVAERAYATLRTRYAGTPQAAAAAFFLARLAADARHDDDSAARLLRIYLREDARGSLVEEARGRLVETLARMGNRSDAVVEAHAYLAQFPDGPHAAMAKALLR